MGVRVKEDFATLPASLKRNGELVVYIGDKVYVKQLGIQGFTMPKQCHNYIENNVRVYLRDGNLSIIVWYDGKGVVTYKGCIYKVFEVDVFDEKFHNPVIVASFESMQLSLRMMRYMADSFAVVVADGCCSVACTSDKESIRKMLRMQENPEQWCCLEKNGFYEVYNRFTRDILDLKLQPFYIRIDSMIGGVCDGERNQYCQMSLEA